VASFADTDAATDRDPVIVADEANGFVVVWSSHQQAYGILDSDADLLASVSSDGGATWSPSERLNPDASDDFARDDSPSLQIDSRGVWMVAWQRRPLGVGDDGLELLTMTGGVSCGDGIVDIGEDCDDDNAVDGDGCDSNCTTTSCGNAVVTTGEACDDGNDSDMDGCLLDCTHAVCGDGVRNDYVEPCDDGNDDDTDDCVAGCRRAECGDGFLRDGIEECDDGNDEAGDGCANCDIEPPPPPCGDADGDGAVRTSDALIILQHAVGLPVSCSMSACDIDGNGRIVASDAWLALRKSVGLPITESCPAPT
jgi:cysteine-rich repeat protein